MKRLLVLSMVGVAGLASANTVFYNGALATGDTTYVNPGGSGVGSAAGMYYDMMPFTVSITGTYTFELASPRSVPAPPQSDALDTFLAIYANSFNPGAPGAPMVSNDDFTGTLTVLPGPYGPNGVTTTATGFQNNQPSSRLLNVSLTAGTQYFLINTSFRRIDYTVVGIEGGAKGNYYGGITGQGDINLVPEPASMAALSLGALALIRRRRARK